MIPERVALNEHCVKVAKMVSRLASAVEEVERTRAAIGQMADSSDPKPSTQKVIRAVDTLENLIRRRIEYETLITSLMQEFTALNETTVDLIIEVRKKLPKTDSGDLLSKMVGFLTPEQQHRLYTALEAES